jgi:DNA-binding CsgD family transcriptional regulator
MEGTIFLTKHAEMAPNHYLSKLNMLNAFADYFKREAASFIERMRFDGYSMERAKGKAFLECASSHPLKASNEQLKQFLKSISPLSPREHECLELYSKGYDSKETAELLGISHRTVEHYFESMKNKLGCFSKREILKKSA